MKRESVISKGMRTALRLVPAAIFIIFVIVMMLRTYMQQAKVKSAVEDATFSLEGFVDFSDGFESVLQANFANRNFYINLDGLTAKVLGINSLNERQKLANGYLTTFETAVDTDAMAESVISLNDFLADRGIEFLYILAPCKTSMYDVQTAPGYESDAWKNIDTMMEAVNNAGVDAIDMDAWFETNGYSMEDVFFKTDHHWKPQGAFAAAQCTMEFLEDSGLADYNRDYLDADNWTVEVYDDWFLGSQGKRVGSKYAGTDDFPVYFPDFETEYSYAGLKTNSTNWTYSDSLLNMSLMDTRNYFSVDTHAMYLYGDYPLQIAKNSDAANDKRILVMGDSFRREWEYFLSTQFSEIYSMDLRHYTDGTLAEYIEEIQPDIVILCTYEGTMTSYSEASGIYTFGVDDYLWWLSQTDNDAEAASLGDCEVAAAEDDNNGFIIIDANLEPDQAYTLTVDSASLEDGADEFVQVTLQNLSTNKAVYNRYFETACDGTQKWIFTTPDDATGNYAIYLYAGTKGHTAGATASIENVVLYGGIIE